MLICTSEHIEGKKIVKSLGLVKGSSARARNAALDLTASIKNIFGGEVEEYSRLLQQTRDQAIRLWLKRIVSKSIFPCISFPKKTYYVNYAY